ITVAVAVWRVIVSVMKISVYLRDGKGLWWRGTWGERRRLTTPFWKRSRDSGEGVRKGIIYRDGTSESDERQ
ncbi:MAG: hypothetical protein DRP09_14580, partial [Candidatus Thorarchaeota archaeon]